MGEGSPGKREDVERNGTLVSDGSSRGGVWPSFRNVRGQRRAVKAFTLGEVGSFKIISQAAVLRKDYSYMRE